jgi:hypothetical protein
VDCQLTGGHGVFGPIEVRPESDATTPIDAVPPLDGPIACAPTYVAAGDYDQDGVPNGQDLCPTDPTVGTSGDSDGDGVGDPCDPNPSSPDECILIFDDFRSASPPCWALTGAWTVGCGAAEAGLCSPPAGDDATIAFTGPQAVTYARVHGQITSVLAPATNNAVQVFLAFDGTNGLTGSTCEVAAHPTAQTFDTATFAYTNGIRMSGSTNPMTPQRLYGPASVVLDWSDGNPPYTRCAGAVSTSNGTASGQVVAYELTGRIAIHTRRTQFRIDAVLGIGKGVACPAR